MITDQMILQIKSKPAEYVTAHWIRRVFGPLLKERVG
jgi:hypothetical protein